MEKKDIYNKYSIEQKVAYHKRRLVDNKVSDNKKCYSKNWLDGYLDEHARNNYNAVCHEIKSRKGTLTKDYAICLYGFKNGLKAKLKKQKK